MMILPLHILKPGHRDRAQSAFKNASVFDYRELYLRCRERLAHQFNTNFKISTRRLQSCETAHRNLRWGKGNLLSTKGNLLSAAAKGNLLWAKGYLFPAEGNLLSAKGNLHSAQGILLSARRGKNHLDFGVLFEALTLCVSIFSWSNFGGILATVSRCLTIDFGVLFDAITICVSIFSWSNFGGILATVSRCLMQLPSACGFFRGEIWARISNCGKCRE